MNKLRLKNAKKSDILPFFVLFMLLSFRYSKKLLVKGVNMYILAIATQFQYFLGFSKPYELFLA